MKRLIVNILMMIAFVAGVFIASAGSFRFHVLLGIALAYAASLVLIDTNMDNITYE